MTSKRNLERRLNRIDNGKQYPELSLATLLAGDEVETIDQERELIQVDGTVYNGSGLMEAFEEL